MELNKSFRAIIGLIWGEKGVNWRLILIEIWKGHILEQKGASTMPVFKPEELSEQALHIIHLSDIHYEKKTTGSNLHFWQLAEQARHSATSTADKKNVKRDALKKLSYEEGVGAAFSANLNGQVFLKTK